MKVLNASARIQRSGSRSDSWVRPTPRNDAVRDRVRRDHRAGHDRPAPHVPRSPHHGRVHHDRRGLCRHAHRARHDRRARSGDRVHRAPGESRSSSGSSPVPLTVWAAVCRRAGGNWDRPRRRRCAGCRACLPSGRLAVRHRASRDGIARCELGIRAAIRGCCTVAAVPRTPASGCRPLLLRDPASGRSPRSQPKAPGRPPGALRALLLLCSRQSP